jgi:beta-N-acetylhexosaminidase
VVRNGLRVLIPLALALGAVVAGVPAKKTAPAKAPAKPASPVRRWMKTLTLHDKIAQLIFIPFHGAAPNTSTREYRKFVRLVRDTHVGGLVLVNWSSGHLMQKAEPYALASFVNRMQRLAPIPLLVSGDFERGASMRVDDTTAFPHAMAFGATGDPALARFEGEVTAREARALGVQWVFFPVADVNSNPDNPIINIRSFGENPQEVAKFVTAFIEGAHADAKNRILTTAKHFPGHGDTAVDTHLNLATIPAGAEQLRRVELVPFEAAIRAGVDSVMTAHIAVPALDAPDVPATTSRPIITGLLREQLGFKGIVVTDALEMGGIAKGYSAGEAAVKALEAGVDVLLMTPDPEGALRAVMAAVRTGRLTAKQIDESVERVLAAKVLTGLDRKRFVDVEAIGEAVNSPEANQRAQEIADRAVTLVRNERNLIPLAAPARTCFAVLSESRSSTSGQAFQRELQRRVHGAQVTMLDPTMPLPAIEPACANFAVMAFASVSAYTGDVALRGDYPKLIEQLVETGKPVALVALGSPYLLRNFPKVAAYLATFSTVPPSEIAAVKALLGEMPIRGHLPVTIPGLAKYGEGIQLAARPASVSSR